MSIDGQLFLWLLGNYKKVGCGMYTKMRRISNSLQRKYRVLCVLVGNWTKSVSFHCNCHPCISSPWLKKLCILYKAQNITYHLFPSPWSVLQRIQEKRVYFLASPQRKKMLWSFCLRHVQSESKYISKFGPFNAKLQIMRRI